MKINSYATHVMNYACSISIIKTKIKKNNYNNRNNNITDHKITKEIDPPTLVISCYRSPRLNK